MYIANKRILWAGRLSLEESTDLILLMRRMNKDSPHIHGDYKRYEITQYALRALLKSLRKKYADPPDTKV